MLIDIIDLGNGRMVDPGGGPRFEEEPFAPRFVPGDLRGEELQGHWALELEVMGSIDHPHPALAEDAVNAVLPQGLTDQGVQHQRFRARFHAAALIRSGCNAWIAFRRDRTGATGVADLGLAAPADCRSMQHLKSLTEHL
jgi:hypothetical protein